MYLSQWLLLYTFISLTVLLYTGMYVLCCKCVVIVCIVCVFVHVWDCECMCGTVSACVGLWVHVWDCGCMRVLCVCACTV